MELHRLIQLYQFRFYGFLLSLTHLATHLFWNAYDFEYGLIYRLENTSFNNWPFVGDAYVLWVSQNSQALVVLYLFFSFLSLLAFCVPRLSDLVLKVIFSIAFVLKLIIYFSSYNFMGNYQYMAHIIFLLFLFADRKFQLLQLALVLFYFGAGLIKLNQEWISGAALLRDTFLPQPWLSLACIYVIFLELIAVWFLGFKKRWLTLGVFLQLLAFHLFSWHIVGFYYPLVMLLMISIFILSPLGFLDKNFLRKRSTVFYIIIFLLAQAYPKILNKDEALTAEGRMFSLNMLDAKTICLPSFEIQSEQGYLYIDEPIEYVTRLRCDPLVWFNYGKRLCKSDQSIVLLNLRGQKTTDRSEKHTVDQFNLCDPQSRYSIFGNSWVKDQKLPSFFNEEITSLHHWRQNESRTGHAKGELPSQLALSHVPIGLQLNYHSAAKSSPLFLTGNRFVVGSDANSVIIGDQTSIHQQTFFSDSSFGIHGSASVINQRYALIGNYNGIANLIDTLTGRRLWASRIGDAIGSSPIIQGTYAYFTTEHLPNKSRIVKVNLQNGQIEHHSDYFDGLAHSSVAARDEYFVFGTNSGLLISYDFKNQRVRWKIMLEGKIQSTPVIFGSSVYAVTSSGELALIQLETGNLLNKIQLEFGTRASPTFDETNKILIVTQDNGIAKAFSQDLQAVLWQQKIFPQFLGSGLITGRTKENLYWTLCPDQFLCALSTSNGKILKKYKLVDSFSSTPDYNGQSLIVTLDNQSGYYYLQNTLKNPEKTEK